jgi:hypothetical protein
MASRTTEHVKHEIETEREALGDAVDTLRGQALRVRRKLPFVAAGIAAVAVVAGIVRHRVFRHHAQETKGRGRFSLHRD